MDRDVALDLVSALSDIKDVLEDILEVLTPAPTDDTVGQGGE